MNIHFLCCMCKEFPFKISLLGGYPKYLLIFRAVTQSAITCSKLAIEKLEPDVKYVQSWQERHQNDASLIGQFGEKS